MSPGFWDKLKDAFAGGAGDSLEGPPSGPFQMKVEDVFSITGRGTVVTGKVAVGSVRTGEIVVLRSASGAAKRCRVSGIEMFRKMLDAASAGDNVGLLLSGVNKDDVARGDTLADV